MRKDKNHHFTTFLIFPSLYKRLLPRLSQTKMQHVDATSSNNVESSFRLNVARCWMLLNKVRFPSNIVFNILLILLFSGMNKNVALALALGHRVQRSSVNARMPTKLTLRVSVSMTTIFCLYLLRALPRECSSYSMANEQSFESLNDESLNTSDLSSIN